jgi:hypothetical protein
MLIYMGLNTCFSQKSRFTHHIAVESILELEPLRDVTGTHLCQDGREALVERSERLLDSGGIGVHCGVHVWGEFRAVDWVDDVRRGVWVKSENVGIEKKKNLHVTTNTAVNNAKCQPGPHAPHWTSS